MKKQPHVSELRNKIYFYSKTKVQQPDFTYIDNETELFISWGLIQVFESSSRPGYTINPTGNFEGIRNTHTITMRWDDRLVPGLVIRSDGFKYKMHGYDPLIYGKKRYMKLRVEQIGDGPNAGDCA
jgi:uncharacterized membrane protein YjgN (DUF898 family)